MTVAWPPWPLPHPSSLRSPHCVAPAHSCPQHPSLSPPCCGANEFSREAPEAQHVGWLHPRPGGPRPASEGPSPAFESAQGVRGPRPEACWGPWFGHSSILRAPPRTAEKAHRPGLGLPVRPEPSLALWVSLDLALPLSSGPLTPQGGSWCHDTGAEEGYRRGATARGPWELSTKAPGYRPLPHSGLLLAQDLVPLLSPRRTRGSEATGRALMRGTVS